MDNQRDRSSRLLSPHCCLTGCAVLSRARLIVFAELETSSVQAQSDVQKLAAELTAAVHRRCAELTQQLQQQKEVSRPQCSAVQRRKTECWLTMANNVQHWQAGLRAVGAAVTAPFPLGNADSTRGLTSALCA